MKNNAIFRILAFFLTFAILISFPVKGAAASTPQVDLGFSNGADNPKDTAVTPKPDNDNNNDQVALGDSDSPSSALGTYSLLAPDALNFTVVAMTIGDKPVNPNIPVPTGSTARLTYTWDIDDSTVVNVGDTYQFQLSPSFSAGTGVPNGIITDENGQTIGTLVLSSAGLVTITFTSSSFVNGSARNGQFYFKLHFATSVVTGPGRQEIALGFSREQPIIFDNPYLTNAMTKKGEITFDSDNNLITTWTVDTNLGYDYLSDPVFVDKLPAWQFIKTPITDYIKIIELEVDMDSAATITEVGAVDPSLYSIVYHDADIQNSDLTVNFNGSINFPVRVVLTLYTHLLHEDDPEYFNKATLDGMGIAADGSAVAKHMEASSTVLNTSLVFPTIQKIGEFNTAKGTMDWEIRFNYEKDLDKVAIFHDKITVRPTQGAAPDWKYDPSSFKVFEVEVDLNTGVVSEVRPIPLTIDGNLIFDPNGKEFHLNIDTTATNKSYRIRYKTFVNSPEDLKDLAGDVFNEAYYGGDTTLNTSNTVPYKPYKPTVGLSKKSTVKPESNTIDWKITFNQSKYNLTIKDPIIRDTIRTGDGVGEIILSTFIIKHGGVPLNFPADFTVDFKPDAVTPMGFEIQFIGDFDDTITIEYSTPFDFSAENVQPNWNHKYRNDVWLDVNYNGFHLTPHSVEEKEVKDPAILNNHKKEGTYNISTKTVDWNVFVNYNNLSLSNFELTDTLGPGQKLVPGSIKLHKIVYNGQNASVGVEVPADIVRLTVENERTYHITLGQASDPISIVDGYVIVCQSMPVGIINPNGFYENRANYQTQHLTSTINGQMDASITIAKSDVFSEKSGAQSGAVVNWKVVINPNQSTVDDATLTDRLSRYQRYVPGSFTLYNASYASDTSPIAKGTAVPVANYDVRILQPEASTGEGFTLSFKDALATISGAYILEYKQEIVLPPDGQLVEVTNSATMGGGLVPINGTNESVAIDTSAGGGIGTSIDPWVAVGGVLWIDDNRDGIRQTRELPLPGVTIVLTNQDGSPVTTVYGNPVPPVVTDANGNYIFQYLPALSSANGVYLTYIDRAASQTVLAPFRPTLVHQGGNTGADSGEWEENTLIPMNVNGAKDLTLDFGFYLLDPFVTVGGIVWIDANKDGIRQPNEVGIKDVTIVLTDSNDQPVTDVYGKPVPPVKTDASGKYVFQFLPVLSTANPEYVTLIDQPASAIPLAPYKPTLDHVGNDTAVDSATWNEATAIPVASGMSDLTLDYGFILTPVGSVTVGGIVWVDTNKDGIRQPSEKGISGVTIKLTDAKGNVVIDVKGNVVPPTLTNSSGTYRFSDLPKLTTGNPRYITLIDRFASQTILERYLPTKDHVGTDTGVDSATWTEFTSYPTVDGMYDLTLDYGFVIPDVPPKPPVVSPPIGPSTPRNPGSNTPDASRYPEVVAPPEPLVPPVETNGSPSGKTPTTGGLFGEDNLMRHTVVVSSISFLLIMAVVAWCRLNRKEE